MLSGRALEDAFESLSHVPILDGLDQVARTELRAGVCIRTYRPGAIIVKYGEPGDSCFIVVSGELLARRINAKGKELTYCAMERGAICGELAILTNGPRGTDVVVEQEAVVAELSSDCFHRLLELSPGFSLNVMRLLASRVASSSERLSDLSFLDLNQRLLTVLSRLAVEIEFGNERRFIVREMPSRQHLATLLSCSREAVSRALKNLEEQSLVVVNQDQVELLLSHRDRAGKSIR